MLRVAITQVSLPSPQQFCVFQSSPFYFTLKIRGLRVDSSVHPTFSTYRVWYTQTWIIFVYRAEQRQACKGCYFQYFQLLYITFNECNRVTWKGTTSHNAPQDVFVFSSTLISI